MQNTHIPKVLFILLGIFGIAAIALFAYIGGRYSQPTQTAMNTDVAVVKNTNTAVVANTNKNTNAKIAANSNAAHANVNDTPVTVTTDVAEGVTWLAEPETLADLGLLTNGYENDHYYRVGTLADGGSVIYMYREEMGKIINRFLENADGTYVLLGNHSEDYILENPTEYLAAGVSVDTKTVYDELYYPETMVVDGLSLSLYTYGLVSYSLLSNLDETDQPVWYADSEYGVVYLLPAAVETTYDDGSIVAKKFLLELPDHSIVSYADTFDFLADDGSVGADWAKDYSDFRDRQYMSGIVAGGCGVLGGNQYPIDMTPEALETVGTTTSGATLYTVLDADSSLLRNAYESYKVGRDYEGSTVDLLSYDEFVAATPVLLWQDAAGDYILFMDNDYAPAVECGKPVVYLYPTQTTDVTVQVGAHVRVSDPAYNDGWNVLAQPSGQLTLADGSVYPNLFWEGKGFGEYPQVTFGRVVPRAQVGLALRSDLIKQGLNAQEIKDFLDFWMPHMPNTPYVRLSWLSTQQLNQLAPLAITPRPDTIIRTFLDFSGQTTSSTTLVPQTLSAIPRNGFTVVEWGGLLLGQ